MCDSLSLTLHPLIHWLIPSLFVQYLWNVFNVHIQTTQPLSCLYIVYFNFGLGYDMVYLMCGGWQERSTRKQWFSMEVCESWKNWAFKRRGFFFLLCLISSFGWFLTFYLSLVSWRIMLCFFMKYWRCFLVQLFTQVDAVYLYGYVSSTSFRQFFTKNSLWMNTIYIFWLLNFFYYHLP